MRYALLLLLGLALAVPAARSEEPAATAPETVTVPFELLKSKHMAVQIKVNGKGPYRVIFDTGAPVTVLNNRIAKEAKLFDKAKNKPLISLFGQAGQVQIKELEVGDLKVGGSSAMIMDHPAVAALSQMLGPIDGIVGFPFFARYAMTIDYQAKKLTFVPNGYDPPDVLEAITKSVMAMTRGDQKPAKVRAAAAQWGLVLHKDAGDDEAGVTVKEVLPDSAAARAGLKANDRLLTLEGRWTDSVADCHAAASYVKAGAEATVVLRRGDQELTLKVKPLAGL